MQTKTDISYGVIPTRWQAGQWEVFLIHQFSRIGNNTYWVFPKGHPEGVETPQETAERELFEETGMKAERIIPEPTFKLKYSFIFEDTKVQKTVEFLIGTISNFETRLDEKEVKEAGWYTLDEAAERLDYKDTKAMFRTVYDFLQSREGEL